jgi:hypothetical protein
VSLGLHLSSNSSDNLNSAHYSFLIVVAVIVAYVETVVLWMLGRAAEIQASP